MAKTIIITGATDGIGLETAKILAKEGHNLLLHGRNKEKLASTLQVVSPCKGTIKSCVADFSNLTDVLQFIQFILENYESVDVLINNAGVLKAPHTETTIGIDIRFVVNTIAPYLLTKSLLPLLGGGSRVINLSSAAQKAVQLDALTGVHKTLEDMDAYAQSKLAITMWSYAMALELGKSVPVVVAINPGSLLASKMVKEGFGIAGKDITIGAKILVSAALDESFSAASGKYFDNDIEKFSNPHIDACDLEKCRKIISVMEKTIAPYKVCH